MTALEDADVVTSSAAYARRFAGPVGSWFLEVQARITLELLRAWPRASVLDVGLSASNASRFAVCVCFGLNELEGAGGGTQVPWEQSPLPCAPSEMQRPRSAPGGNSAWHR